jgi:SAM-dependent methyltransferase
MWNGPLSRRKLLRAGLAAPLAASAWPRALLAQEPERRRGEDGGVSDPGRWDRVFGQPKPAYRADPNAYLAAMLARMRGEELLPGERALDLAMGDGRNALLLAENGLQVTGLDISPVALEKARARALERGLALQALEQDLFAYDYGVERWDLVTLIYFNPAVRILDRLKAAVAPEGLLLIEGQGSEHVGDGPPQATRFRPNQLLQAFHDWRVLDYEDGRFPCDWAPGAPTHVVRLLARKPRPRAK